MFFFGGSGKKDKKFETWTNELKNGGELDWVFGC